MKKITLCLMLILALIIVPVAIFAAEETVEVDTYQELVDALADSTKTTIKLVGGFELDSTVAVTRSVTIINGGDYKITTKSGVGKSFEIKNTTDEYINVKFEDVTITNATSKGRCIDTRNDKINLTLDGVKLNTTGSGNNQALTIGGNDLGGLKVNIVNGSSISAGTAGYGIISFVPADLLIQDSYITGYAALYVKPGSAGLKVNVENSTLEGNNNYGVDTSSDFGTIVLEESSVTININKNSKIISSGKGTAKQFVVMDKTTEGEGSKIDISSATIEAKEEVTYLKNDSTKLSVGVGVTSNVEIPKEYLPEGVVLEKGENGYVAAKRIIKVEGLEYAADEKETEKILLESFEKWEKENPEIAKEVANTNITIGISFNEVLMKKLIKYL